MSSKQSILIRNIYYMLAYAFQVLKQSNYEDIGSEEFENIQDLFAAILSKGIGQQLKQGLYREYITRQESLPVLRGKLDIYGTMSNVIQRRQQLSCEFDELSENIIFNQILKLTASVLMREKSVKLENRSALKKLMLFFHSVDDIEPSAIKWNTLRYHRNNQSYRMLLNICYFVLDGLLQTTTKGEYKMATFSDEHLHRLYERFVLEYYRSHKEELGLRYVSASQVDWLLDAAEQRSVDFLPKMQTDVMLHHRNGRTLIIDTKYYSRTMLSQHDKPKLHSSHLYQIFAYVKNKDSEQTGKVSGMVLYAKTDEEVTPDYEFVMGGNRFGVTTLDLNTDFEEIKRQLDAIAREYLEPGEALGATS